MPLSGWTPGEADVPNVYQIFDQIVENVPAGSGRVIFTPWLYGERTPVENHSDRSGIFNMSLNTTREHIIRAVFEGVAYNSKWFDTFAGFVYFLGSRDGFLTRINRDQTEKINHENTK